AVDPARPSAPRHRHRCPRQHDALLRRPAGPAQAGVTPRSERIVAITAPALVVEVDARRDLDEEDGGDEPVDGSAEGWPPARIGDELVALLPEVLESVAGKADHQDPGLRGDGGRCDHD